MKKILLSAGVIIIALAAGSSFAQQKTNTATTTQQSTQATSRQEVRKAKMQNMTPEQMAQMRTDRINKDVNLTKDQEAKVHAIFLKEAQQNKGRMAERKATQEQLRAVLNKDQAQKLDEIKKERMNKMREQRTERTTSAHK